jgi:hypothetical protein
MSTFAMAIPLRPGTTGMPLLVPSRKLFHEQGVIPANATLETLHG